MYIPYLKKKKSTKSSPENEKCLDIQTTPVILQTDQSYIFYWPIIVDHFTQIIACYCST